MCPISGLQEIFSSRIVLQFRFRRFTQGIYTVSAARAFDVRTGCCSLIRHKVRIVSSDAILLLTRGEKSPPKNYTEYSAFRKRNQRPKSWPSLGRHIVLVNWSRIRLICNCAPWFGGICEFSAGLGFQYW